MKLFPLFYPGCVVLLLLMVTWVGKLLDAGDPEQERGAEGIPHVDGAISSAGSNDTVEEMSEATAVH